MDLEEWELVSDEIQGDDGKKIFPKTIHGNDSDMMEYSRCRPLPEAEQFVQEPNQLIPQLDYPVVGEAKEIIEIPTVVSENLVPDSIKILEGGGGDQDEASQVFLKKIKENECIDMNLDSPTSPRMGNREFLPQDEEVAWGESDGGMNMWKTSVNGIGAIFSFGVAAATICVIIFGSAQRNKQNHKLRFQIHTDNKSLNQVVYQASKLNEAGVHPTRARITYGGYFESL